jgi:hypothetical protein
MTAVYVILIIAAVLVLLYFLAIKPRLGRRKNWDGFRDVYYAHRGRMIMLPRLPKIPCLPSERQ